MPSPRPPRQRVRPETPPRAPWRVLQVVDNPLPGRDEVIRFDVPDPLCVEPKSLKQHFWRHRNVGVLHEQLSDSSVDPGA